MKIWVHVGIALFFVSLRFNLCDNRYFQNILVFFELKRCKIFEKTQYCQFQNVCHTLLHVIAGYYSWRNTTKGSWFVQSLCEELRRRAHTNDILTILTFVSQRVAVDYESNVPDSVTMHRQKQIPCIMSMLTRLLQFRLPQ